MSFFFKKQKEIIGKIENYLSKIDECRDRFHECVKCLIYEEHPARYEELVDRVHRAESEADDIRRDIEFDLYKKTLLPESRGDVLGILEAMDKIPNYFEAIAFQFYLQRLIVPREAREDFMHLVEVNIQAYEEVKKAVRALFYNTEAFAVIQNVDDLESRGDKIERALIKKIYLMDLDKADKIMLKQVILTIGDVSDRAQAAADRLRLAIIKRKI